MGWMIEDNNGIILASGGGVTGEDWEDETYYNYCLPISMDNSCDIYNLILVNSWCGGWEICSDATAIITAPNGDTLLFASEFNDGCSEAFPFTTAPQGCIDPTANNYDPNAICDDGSCCYDDPIIDITQITWLTSTDHDCNNFIEQDPDTVIFNNNGTGNIFGGDLAGDDPFNFSWYLCGSDLILDADDDLDGFNINYLTYNIYGNTFTGTWYGDGHGHDHDDGNDDNENSLCITLYSTIGCMDPTAYNYTPTAVSSDSSCQYCTIDVTTISIDPSSIYNCDGSAFAIVNNNIGSVEYNWSTGDEEYFISGICEGIYTVQVTDSVGCTASDTFTIVQNGVVFGGVQI